MREGQDHDFARRLRKSSTDTERLLWRYLRHKQLEGFRFRRKFRSGRTSQTSFVWKPCSSLKSMAGSTMSKLRMNGGIDFYGKQGSMSATSGTMN